MQKLLFCVLVGLLATRLSAQDFKFNIDPNLKGIRPYISAPQVSKNIMPEPLFGRQFRLGSRFESRGFSLRLPQQ